MELLPERKGIQIVNLPFNKGAIFSNLANQLKQIVQKQVFMRVVWSVLSG